MDGVYVGVLFAFLLIFLHLAIAIFHASHLFNPNTGLSGIIIYFFFMATALMGFVLPFGPMSL